MTDDGTGSSIGAATGEVEPRPTSSYRTVLVLLAAGAALIFLGFGQVWSTSVVTQQGLPTLTVELSGRDVAPAGAAMALVALAGIAALVATRRTGRLITSVVLVVSGLVAAWSAVASGATSTQSQSVVLSDRTGVEVSNATTTTGTGWWVVAALGGALVAVAGLMAVRTCSSWSVLGGRYERAAGGPAPAPEPTTARTWDDLDRGIDPTVDPDQDPALGTTLRPGSEGEGGT